MKFEFLKLVKNSCRNLPDTTNVVCTPVGKRFVAGLLALQMLVAFCPADASSAPAVTFRGLTIEGSVHDIYFDDADGQSTEFVVRDYIRSAFHKAPGGSAMAFYRILPSESAGQPPKRETVGQVEWPTSPGPYLVLVSQSGGRYEFSVVPEDELSFPMGSFRIFNASKARVLIKAGNEEAVIKPQGSTTLRPSPPEEGKGILFQVSAELNPVRQVYSNLWSGSQTTRTLVFIVNRANPNYPIGVRRLHESDLVLKHQREKEESRR